MNTAAEMADYDDGSLDPLYWELRDAVDEYIEISHGALMTAFEGMLTVSMVVAYQQNNKSSKNIREKLATIIRGDFEEMLAYCQEKRHAYKTGITYYEEGLTQGDLQIYHRLKNNTQI